MARKTQPRETYFYLVWSQFKKNRQALCSLWGFLALAAMALLAPVLANNKPIILKHEGEIYFPALIDYPQFKMSKFRDNEKEWRGSFYVMPPIPYSPTEYDLELILGAPTHQAIFGSDDRGRNVLARMIHGLRISLGFATLVVAVSCLVGVALGGVMGYYGGLVDLFGQRVLEVLMLFPKFFLQLTALAFLPQSVWVLIGVYVLFGWISYTRYARAEFLKLRNQDFVQSARAAGAGDAKIIFRHILPNAMAPILVLIPFDFAGSILGLSVLSFLGFGLPPPTPSIGELLDQAKQHFEYAWWLAVYPGVLLFITLTLLNFIGEGLRDATDPFSKRA